MQTFRIYFDVETKRYMVTVGTHCVAGVSNLHINAVNVENAKDMCNSLFGWQSAYYEYGDSEYINPEAPDPDILQYTKTALRNEIRHAREKFPKNGDMLTALMEEVGELAQAMLEHKRGAGTQQAVINEAIQAAVMAIRIIEEGDSTLNFVGLR